METQVNEEREEGRMDRWTAVWWSAAEGLLKSPYGMGFTVELSAFLCFQTSVSIGKHQQHDLVSTSILPSAPHLTASSICFFPKASPREHVRTLSTLSSKVERAASVLKNSSLEIRM
jgi:hypothetical protein